MVDLRRRLLLRGGAASDAAAPLRPPWALPREQDFQTACTRCGDCTKACPRSLIVRGGGGFPEIRFDDGGCTFCGDCARSCTTGALDREAAAGADAAQHAFSARATIDGHCLAAHRVECRVCGEACEARAIRFVPRLGGVAVPLLDVQRCTGCGECVAGCPARAVRVTAPPATPCLR